GLAEEALAELLDALVHRGHDAAENDPAHGRPRHAPVAEEPAQDDHPLVDGAGGLGPQPPVHCEGRALVEPDQRVRVVDVDREHHRSRENRSGGYPPDRSPSGTVPSPPTTRNSPCGPSSRSAPSSSTPSTRPVTSPSGAVTRTSFPVKEEYASHSDRI